MTCTSVGELAFDTALAAIEAADTAAAAQAAYDAVDQKAITGDQALALQAAVEQRVTYLDAMDRQATQTQALMDAAGMIDTSDLSTQEAVDAARAAIAGLRQAIADAVDVDDTSMYQTTLDDAVGAVDMAQGGIDTDTRRTNQMTALSEASDALQAALAALSGATPTQALLDDANSARTALDAAIMGGADLTDAEKAPYQREADNAAGSIDMAQMAVDDAEADKTAAAAMAVTAMKLYDGIGAPSSTDGEAAQREAAYNPSSTDGADITVTWGADDTTAELMVDEDVPVAARHGWEGMRFTASSGGTYEAVVYSHVGDPTVTEGAAFNMEYPLDATPVDGTPTELGIDTSATDVPARVASPSFDHSAGTKPFELGSNMVRVMLSGSYHGVSGTYNCTPNTGETCSASVADEGFTLAGGTWTFKPTNPEAKLMDTEAADMNYASYGWWLHTAENGTLTASAFHSYRGADSETVGIAALRGAATYMGGAAGKYSLRGDTGGTNDAGHFTADVTLEAEFGEEHTISGTIDNFMGADGMARDWSVELMGSAIADTGGITGTTADANAGDQMTTWTIGEDAAEADGSWSGDLREQGNDGVPALATGTFYSTYGHAGNDGVMVGAFGANVQ